MVYALVIWTVVAMSGANAGNPAVSYDWRLLTEHRTLEKCEQAAKQLGYTKDYKCVSI